MKHFIAIIIVLFCMPAAAQDIGWDNSADAGLARFSVTSSGMPTSIRFFHQGLSLLTLHPDGTVEPGEAWVTTEDSAQKFIEWLEVYWSNSVQKRECVAMP